ncbi:hypothetical protein CF160_09380 [Enterococcus pseudoavium]|nr:hypothetical protein CF160_09380 [Enterococcus pseudoavium]
MTMKMKAVIIGAVNELWFETRKKECRYELFGMLKFIKSGCFKLESTLSKKVKKRGSFVS